MNIVKDKINNINITSINTNKFKTSTLSIRFVLPLVTNDALLLSLLSQSLVDRTQKYDTKQALSNALDNLYGMNIHSTVNSMGSLQCLELKMKFINPSFIDDQTSFMQDINEFIYEVIKNPLFNEALLEESKQNLSDKVIRMLDDPTTYATTKFYETIGADTSLAIHNYGDLAKLDAVSVDDLANFYKRLLSEANIYFLSVGMLPSNELNELVAQLDLNNVSVQYNPITNYRLTNNDLIVGNKQIPQSIICMLYDTNSYVSDDDYLVGRVMNGLLGGFSSSLLFQEVREKNSLCYSIYSYLLSFDGLMQINTGVNPKDVDKTIELIKVQIARLKQGEFEDSVLENAITMLVNTYNGINDDANAILNISFQHSILNQEIITKERVEALKSITKADVIKFAQKLDFISTYVLTKGEADEN